MPIAVLGLAIMIVLIMLAFLFVCALYEVPVLVASAVASGLAVVLCLVATRMLANFNDKKNHEGDSQ